MAGFFTPGLPAPTLANGALPLPAAARVPVDTGLANGEYPQSVAASVQQLIANGGFQALTDGTNIAYDASAASMGSVTLGGSRNLVLSNMAAGQIARLKVTQDGTGSRVLTITAGSGGATLVSGTPLSTAASSVDLVEIQNVGTLAAPLYAYYPVAKALA